VPVVRVVDVVAVVSVVRVIAVVAVVPVVCVVAVVDVVAVLCVIAVVAIVHVVDVVVVVAVVCGKSSFFFSVALQITPGKPHALIKFHLVENFYRLCKNFHRLFHAMANVPSIVIALPAKYIHASIQGYTEVYKGLSIV